jgi:hypothetical protein
MEAQQPSFRYKFLIFSTMVSELARVACDQKRLRRIEVERRSRKKIIINIYVYRK